MEQFRDWISKAIDAIEDQFDYSENNIIIGDNASGKSELMKGIVKSKLNKGERVYFIDSVNRTFQISQVSHSMQEIEFSEKIVKTRLKDDYFNLRDSWDYYGTKTECIELIYRIYEERIQKYLREFLNNSFQIWIKESQEVKYANGEIGKISSGYQAMVRLLLELLYVDESWSSEQGRGTVVIDEIDEYLSPKNAGRLHAFLRKIFPDVNFIVSTHSADFIAGAMHSGIVVLRSDGIEFLNSDDFCDMNDVIAMFRDVFGNSTVLTDTRKTDQTLRILLNNKMNGVWGETENYLMKIIGTKKLSNVQKLIYRQIEEW